MNMPVIFKHGSKLNRWVQAYSLEELFSKALNSMNGLLYPELCQQKRHSDCCLRVQLRAENSQGLLEDFLSEVLAQTYIQRAVFCYVIFDELDAETLIAHIYGRWYQNLETEVYSVKCKSTTRAAGTEQYQAVLVFEV
jgi:SHS2 domain-containing protein